MRLEARLRYLLCRQVGERAPVDRNERRVCAEREVDSRIGHKIRLKLDHVDVYRSGETKRSRATRHNLRDDAIEIRVSWAADFQVRTANVVNGFVVKENVTVGVIHRVMSRQQGVVRLDDNWRNPENEKMFFGDFEASKSRGDESDGAGLMVVLRSQKVEEV